MEVQQQYVITRVNGDTTLNGRQFLLDGEDNLMVFDSVEDAEKLLAHNGIKADGHSISIDEYEPPKEEKSDG